jgi:methyl halide transferase
MIAAMTGLTSDFWQAKFESNATPWDRGEVSPQLRQWLLEQALVPCRIVVPGCGSGHEVALLAQCGFDVAGIDYAAAAIARTRAALAAANTHAEVIEADVLTFTPGSPFDAVYEQTCLCALHPDDWIRYARRLHDWLRPGGRLFALLAQVVRPRAANGVIEGPPYHCDINAMRALFDATRWQWPAPPYERVQHPMGFAELAVVLTRA